MIPDSTESFCIYGGQLSCTDKIICDIMECLEISQMSPKGSLYKSSMPMPSEVVLPCSYCFLWGGGSRHRDNLWLTTRFLAFHGTGGLPFLTEQLRNSKQEVLIQSLPLMSWGPCSSAVPLETREYVLMGCWYEEAYSSVMLAAVSNTRLIRDEGVIYFSLR